MPFAGILLRRRGGGGTWAERKRERDGDALWENQLGVSARHGTSYPGAAGYFREPVAFHSRRPRKSAAAIRRSGPTSAREGILGLTDIPQQIATVLKYSLRSRTSFLSSLIGAIFVLGFAFDLLYGFFYTRVFNAKAIHYGHAFWIGLVAVALVVPLTVGLIRLILAERQLRPFPPGKHGVAIAPFDAVSLDPDTLGTASKLGALDAVMTQFFKAQQRIIEDEEWSKDFEFRFLPPFVQVQKKKDAATRLQAMAATLIIWGQINQESGAHLKVTMHFLGPQLDIKLDGDLLPSLTINLLEYFALCAAGFANQGKGDLVQARRMFELARTPGSQIDQMAKSNSNVAAVDDFIRRLDPTPAPNAPAAAPVSPNPPAPPQTTGA